MIGKTLAHYKITEKIGAGGMGEVWRAEHQMLKREAAVKVIRPGSLPGEGPEQASILKRFEREARAASALKSPHTIQLYDFGIAADGTFYYAMELLEGCNLETLVARNGPIRPARAVHLLRQICESLTEAHHHGLIHRDIKPANTFLCQLGLRYDFVKVLDFGLVRYAPETGPQRSQLTAENVTVGSPSFMAPEAVRGSAAVDRQSDIYSLGCLAYWLLTGQLVFEAQNHLEMILAHVQKSPAAPSVRTEMTIPPELDRIVMQCLEKDPMERPLGAQVLSQALEECPVGTPWTDARAEAWWQAHRPQSWGAGGRPHHGDREVAPDDEAAANRSPGAAPSLATTTRSGADVDRPSVGLAERRPHARFAETDSAEAFVGREQEWEVLHDVWTASCSGGVQMLLVTGEAGIGKTRLVEKLAAAAAAAEDGARIARTRSYEAEGRMAWGPVTDLLRSDALRPRIDRLDDVWTRELARLLPELRAGGPDHAGLSPINDPTQRRVLFEAVGRVMEATDEPLLLIVDDLQWCDRESIEFLHYLLRSRQRSRLLLAGTARLEEVDEDHPLTALRVGFHREGTVLTELDLSRLDAEATAELAAKLTGTTLSEAATALLYRETEGNPLFVVEAVRAGMTESDATPLQSPTVRAVIQTRLAKLTDGARSLLELAATVGRQFSVDVLVAAGAGDENEIETSLEELWQRELIRDHEEGYDFSHDKIREAAYDRISPVRRRRLHKTVASTLEQRHAENPYPVSARLAAHYEAAGLASAAIEAHRRAAAHSLSVFALDDAIETFSRALQLVERLPVGKPRTEAELTLQTELGSSLIAKVGYGDPAVESVYQRALQLSKQLYGRASPPVLRGLALSAINHCRFDRAKAYGMELLEQAQDDSVVTVEAHYVLGVATFWQGALEESIGHLEEVVARYEPEHSPVHTARFAQDPYAVCLARLGLTLWYVGRPERAARLVEEAVQVAEALHHPYSLQYALCYAAIMALQLGDRPLLEMRVRGLHDCSAVVPAGIFGPMIPLLEGWLAVLDGSSRGIDLIREGTEGYRVEGRTLHRTLALSWLAAAHLRAGDPSDGLAAVEEAIQWTEAHEQWYLESELLRLEGELRAAQGAVDAGVDTIRRARDVAASRGARALELRAACALTRLTGDTTLLQSVYATFSEGLDSGDLVEAASLLATD